LPVPRKGKEGPLDKSEIQEEQRLIDHAYERLDEMQRRAQGVADAAMAKSFSAGPERDAIVESGLRRVKHLEIGDEPLVFGRVDNRDGAVHHIGRVAVYDAEYEPLVTDWRAPAAEPFYRATPADSLGIVRRRHILSKDRKVIHLEDELLDAAAAESDGLVLVGEAALLNALRRSRTGRMHDIVATIQREQDEVIRAPLEGMLVVQGGPGTGKTAVALHRAAYLLYAHRDRLTRTGVLVIGPNAIFMRYIEQVLPTLGETATLVSIGELVPGVRVSSVDDPVAARIKGDRRMGKVIERAARDLERGLDNPTTIEWEGTKLRVSVAESRRIVKFIRERVGGTHNAKRADICDLVIEYLYDKWLKAQRRFGSLYGEETRESFERDLRTDESLMAVLDAMWPVRSSEDLVRAVLSDAGTLAKVAEGILDPDEQQAILRDLDAGLTENDIALIDEAAPMLGPVRRRERRRPRIDPEERFHIERLVDDLQELEPIIRLERRAFIERLVDQRLELDRDDEDYKTPPREIFGHVVIDEAQSLSPMQWRMIARRVPAKSMTVVGDLGQNTGVWTHSSWDDVIDEVAPSRSSVVELSINYRSPAPVADVATRILAVAAPELTSPRAVRSDGDPPVVIDASGDPVPCAADVARKAVNDEGTVAVIAPPELVADLRVGLGIASDADAASLLDEPIAVLTVEDARGLEFDTVIVVEPGALAGETVAGLRALYVAVTRSTRSLTIVHSEPLPRMLR
jgi:DNA helicase IV